MSVKYQLSLEELNKIINDYLSGKTLREMEKDSLHCRAYLSKVLKENGVDIRDNTINSRKYSHNENFFEDIDNEIKAYWLGFIYADGYIESKRRMNSQKFGITLNSIDENHLYKFKRHIEANNPIKNYIGSGYNSTGKFSKILLTSQKTVDDLKRLGVVENKTNELVFLDNTKLSNNLIRHFVRGYFDGDGTIYCSKDKKYNHLYYQISFTGTKEMILGIRKFFNKDIVIKARHNAFYMNIGGNLQVKNLLDILYKDSSVYLERKHNKYLDLCKYIER